MADSTFLGWPFFEERHRAFARRFGPAAESLAAPYEGVRDDAEAARRLWQGLSQIDGTEPLFGRTDGETVPRVDLRTVALMRETLAYRTGIADVALSEPWLAGLPIALAGTPVQRAEWLGPIATGRMVPAFALSEPDAGTDVGSIATAARRDGDDYVIDGTKTWTSNAGAADLYVVFAKLAGADDARAMAAFLVPGGHPGVSLLRRVAVMPPHAVGTLRFEKCRVPASAMLGAPGQGMALALRALELFRPTVGAATLGFARRALDEALQRARSHSAFGRKIFEYQLIQKKIAEMAVAIDSAALLVYRACWLHDVGGQGIAREAAMAKLFATETAQRVVDEAVQIAGGSGVVRNAPVERMYREVRAFRIFDGASDIQKLIIARHVLASEPAHA